MRQTSYLSFLTLTLAVLSGCSSTLRQAPVIERAAPAAEAPHPAVQAAQAAAEETPKEVGPGMYQVKKGDTLIRIALDHGQNYRDLVTWNNLANPNDIKADQILRVEAPDHPVQTAPVSMPPSDKTVARKAAPHADKKAELAQAEAPKPDAAKAEAKPADKPADPPLKLAAAGTMAGAGNVPPAPPATPPASAVVAAEIDKLGWIWPSEGKVVAGFEEGKTKGVDIAGKAGQQVLAASAGKVMYAGSGIRGYGNLVIVKHSDTVNSVYAHNRAILVKEGQTVSKGQAIAEMGDSDTDAVKLHFEIRQQGKPVDPIKFLPSR